MQRLNQLNSSLFDFVELYNNEILKFEGKIEEAKQNIQQKRNELYAVKKEWGDKIEIAMNNVSNTQGIAF